MVSWSRLDNNLNLRVGLGKVDKILLKILSIKDLTLVIVANSVNTVSSWHLHHALVASPVFAIVENHLSALQNVGTNTILGH
jgi:hypothetical protein